MNEECVECIFCKLPHGPTSFVPLKTNLEKFENLLETFDFEQDTVKDLLICFSCNQLLDKFFDFKSKFVEKEDELVNYTDAENTVDLCKVLISKGLLEKNHDGDKKLQICRMCYETNADNEFAVVEYGSKFNTFITTCIEEFDLFLLNETFICGECCTVLLSFYRFLLTCIQAVKSVAAEMAPSTDPLALEKNFDSEVEASTNFDSEVKAITNFDSEVEASTNFDSEVEASTNFDSEVEASTTVPEANVEEIIKLEPCRTPLDEPPDKKHKAEIANDIIEVPSDEEQSIKSLNNGFEIVDVQKLLNSSNRITPKVETPDLETASKKKADMYKPVEKPNHRLSRLKKSTKAKFEKLIKCCYECQICPVQYNSFDEMKKHITSHFTEKMFTCWMCQKILEGANLVEFHFKREHGIGLYKEIEEIEEFDIPIQDTKQIFPNKKKMFECHICWLCIDNVFQLQEHFSRHIKSNRFLCFTCDFRCGDFQAMRNHLASTHGVSTLYGVINESENNFIKKETEPISDEIHISCPRCLRNYNTIENFVIHPCSKADNNKHFCPHCSCVLPTLGGLHDCKGTPENKNLDSSKTDKPPSEHRHSIETKSNNCNLCRISFETSQKLDNHNCTAKVAKSSNPAAQSLTCIDCTGKFESYDELIGHIGHDHRKFVLVRDVLKIDDDDTSASTAVTDTTAITTANSCSDVIDIDSDSDTEFVEPNCHQPARVVKEIRAVDLQEASQLISQGIPVVTPNNLQYQPLMMPVIGQQGMLMNNRLPIMNSDTRAHYMNSGGRVYVTNGNGENRDTPLMWPSDSNITQNETGNLSIPKLLPIQALEKSVENIMPAVPLKPPKIVTVTNNDYSLVISDDETEISQQNSSRSSVNDEMKENARSTEEQNNFICISDDDEIQEIDDCSTLQEQSTNKESDTRIKRPPTSFSLYKEKLKPELDKKFPLLKPRARLKIAVNTWKNLEIKEKWPFMEEARLLRELFKREHPGLWNTKTSTKTTSKTQRKKPVPIKPAATQIPVMPQISAVFTLVDTPIVLD
ncbi:unnamed protein product [Ceutorhynchus assimilis]|uniref:Uncharacterized protein n=1 Tax=Ceutorhynchus assimilis TaxID=467358 RepID=A0A9P0GMU3_9CUCU|nr:unnamed protein product [Ceutorhynchus assimilis]